MSVDCKILPRRLEVCYWTYDPSAKAKRDETACWKAITEQAELLQGLAQVDYGAKCSEVSSNQRGASPTFQG